MSSCKSIFWLLGAFFCVAIANSITAAHQKTNDIIDDDSYAMMMTMSDKRGQKR